MSEPSDAGLWIVAVSIVATFFWILIFPHPADKHPSSANKKLFQTVRIDAVLQVFCGGFTSTADGGVSSYEGSSFTLADVDVDCLKSHLERNGCLPVTSLVTLVEKNNIKYTKVKMELLVVQRVSGLDLSTTHITTLEYLGQNVDVPWDSVIKTCCK